MVKYRHAYYEACGIMIEQSAHKAHLADQYDIDRIFAPPTDEEFENETRNYVPLKGAANDDLDEDEDDDGDELSDDEKASP